MTAHPAREELRAAVSDSILDALCDSPVWENRHIGELEVHICDQVAERLLAGPLAALLAAQDDKPPRLDRLRILGTWLTQESDGCTCGAGPGYNMPDGCPHEPNCGLEPIVDLSTLPGWGAQDDSEARLALAAEFRREVDPSTTGVWREACDLLDRIADRAEAAPPTPDDSETLAGAHKATGWQVAHDEFCPLVKGFAGCQAHDNPYRAEAAPPAERGETTPVTRAWVAYDDGSRSPIERWVRRADGQWVSLDSQRARYGDLMMALDDTAAVPPPAEHPFGVDPVTRRPFTSQKAADLEHGRHLHTRACIHNLTPDEQIAARGKTREWYEQYGIPILASKLSCLRARIEQLLATPDDVQEWEHEDGRSIRRVQVIDAARLRSLLGQEGATT